MVAVTGLTLVCTNPSVHEKLFSNLVLRIKATKNRYLTTVCQSMFLQLATTLFQFNFKRLGELLSSSSPSFSRISKTFCFAQQVTSHETLATQGHVTRQQHLD